ncbi:HicB family protein [Campylobacter sputorum]|uniref:HicB family protein n=1 Tax=Campylobacter sputorum TaxID=206 RepID=UPI00053BE218|nr:HicB family protein [Campylobacter sputorum]
MKKDLDYYLNLPYTIVVKKLNDGDYFAKYSDAGLIKNNLMAGWGKSEMEAIKDLKEAFACYVESALKNGETIYEPIDENVKIRINLTIPKGVVNAIDLVTKNRSAWLCELAKKELAI